MGVDLKPLIISSPVSAPDLSDKLLAIDAFNTIYQFLATIRGPTGELLKNENGEVTSHLSGLFYRNLNLIADGLKLVYVFDGKSSELKIAEIERRRKIKQEAVQSYNQALDEGRMEDARKFSQATSVLTSDMVQESKQLLSLLGIPFIQAKSEGEAAAAHLTRIDFAFASASQDYDSVLFGAKRLIRNLTVSGKRKVPNRNIYLDVEPEMIEFEKILQKTNLTHEQLVDVGILIGTDFNPGGLIGVGPKTALKLIREFGSLENVEKARPLVSEIPYREIRNIFLGQENPLSQGIDTIEFRQPDYDGIIDYLCIKKNFSAERVNAALNKLKKTVENKSESLEKWFG
jgi:flap endonuclease-1